MSFHTISKTLNNLADISNNSISCNTDFYKALQIKIKELWEKFMETEPYKFPHKHNLIIIANLFWKLEAKFTDAEIKQFEIKVFDYLNVGDSTDEVVHTIDVLRRLTGIVKQNDYYDTPVLISHGSFSSHLEELELNFEITSLEMIEYHFVNGMAGCDGSNSLEYNYPTKRRLKRIINVYERYSDIITSVGYELSDFKEYVLKILGIDNRFEILITLINKSSW